MTKINFFENQYYMLSNWSAHQVEIWEKVFPTADHAYHYKKFEQNYPEIALQIISARSPLAAKQVADENKDKARKFTDDEKISLFYEINLAKVQQHPEVRNALIMSADNELIEDSPYDSFWGLGSDGNGRNELGKVWMDIRERMKNGSRRMKLGNRK